MEGVNLHGEEGMSMQLSSDGEETLQIIQKTRSVRSGLVCLSSSISRSSLTFGNGAKWVELWTTSCGRPYFTVVILLPLKMMWDVKKTGLRPHVLLQMDLG